jgi:hypothetical protein
LIGAGIAPAEGQLEWAWTVEEFLDAFGALFDPDRGPGLRVTFARRRATLMA